MDEDFSIKRTHERKRYETDIVFAHKEKAYRGTVKDVSLGGAFIISDNANLFEEGEMVTVSIPYTSGKKHVKRRGRIKWFNNEGFAIEFL
ncbi:MAG: PilZ domain-containing protein [Desulfosarcinaceae bacterium]